MRPQVKYFCYLAVIGAVLLDLYAANPETGRSVRLALDAVALIFAVGGLAGLAMDGGRLRRR